MLIHYGPSRSATLDFRLGYSLAFIAGALNSAGYYSLGFFAANMTGNFSAGVDQLALGDLLSGAVYLLLPAAFIIGAALAALVIELGLRRGQTRIFAVSIMTEAALLVAMGLLDLAHQGRGMVLVSGLCLLLGFQNAVVTRISNWKVRATHVSGMSTDIGISLGQLLADRVCGQPAKPLLLDNLKLYSTTIGAFCVGGLLGVLAYKLMGGGLLLLMAGLLVLVAGPGLRRGASLPS